MAMYYYARKLQKSSKKAKTMPQTPITANGSIPNSSNPGGNSGAGSCSSSSSTSQVPQQQSTTTHNCTPNSDGGQNPVSAGTQNLSTSSTLKSQDWNNALVYQDTNLVSGTLDALIAHLVPSGIHYPDRAYIFAFLLSSRLYIRPHELLGCVFRLAFITPPNSPNFLEGPNQILTVTNMVRLLSEWTEMFPFDYKIPEMMAHVRAITQKCVAIDPQVKRDVTMLLTSLLAKLTALERHESFLQKINAETTFLQPSDNNTPPVQAHCPDPKVMAEQLTHVELEHLSHIGPEEFVQAFVKENPGGDVRPKELKKTRNLESYVQWFNRLNYIVASDVCKHRKKKTRARVIEYWVQVATECFNIANFNSLMAVITGLNMSPVARLKKTWGKVSSSDQLSVLEQQMDPSSNFASYRALLKTSTCRASGTTDERQKCVIPFFSLLIKDLYFLNEACSSKLSNGHINFDKFWQLAKQVSEVIAWQQVVCAIPKVHTLMTSIQTLGVFNESALFLVSFECESPDNSEEKARFKFYSQQAVLARESSKKVSSTTKSESLDACSSKLEELSVDVPARSPSDENPGSSSKSVNS